jgi:Uncharacterised nucleotidyltransferase
VSDREQEEQVAREAWFALLRGSAATHAAKPAGDEWSLLAEEAVRHELGSLTYRLVSDSPWAADVPAEVQQRLRALYLKSAVRNAVLLRQTTEAAAALGRLGIPVMLLKGIHLCRFVYPEPALRVMADVDLMVPRDRLARAEQMFLERGFGPLPRADIEERCSWSNHLAKLQKEGAPVYELHWGIERPTSPFKIDLDGLWSRARKAALDDSEIHLLGPEDLLLHLAIHGSYHHGFDRAGLKALIDVNAVVKKHGGEIDWRVLAERANQWEASGFAYTTLRLAREILGTPVPEETLDSLVHRPEDEEVVEVASRFVLVPEVRLTKPYLALAGSPRLKERVAVVARAVFLPRQAMERAYHLKPGSLLLYPAYLWRLGDLLVRRGRLALSSLFRTRAVHPALERRDDKAVIASWVGRRAGGQTPSADSEVNSLPQTKRSAGR